MTKILLLLILIFSYSFLKAQNVGINQSNPTNSLHVNPINIGDNPLRFEGLQPYSIGDTSLLIINNSTGVVKYITSNDLVTLISNGNGLGTDNQTLDSLTLNNYVLTAYLEDGGNAFIDLSAISDSTINTLYNNADTLLYNNNFINSLRDSIDSDVDSVILNGTILHIYENGNDVFTNLNNLQDGTGTDSQTLTLTNNSLSISGGNSVNLSQFTTPSGAIFAFPTSTAPAGYLSCNGQAVSRTTYSNLFTLIGTSYGAGNGSTTFNLPNYNGQFLRGWDNGQGIDLDAAIRTDRGDGTTGDIVGSKQANQNLAHNHTVNPPATNSNSTGSHLHTINPPSTTSNATGNHLHTVNPPSTNTNTTGAHSHSVNPPNTTTTTNGNHSHGALNGNGYLNTGTHVGNNGTGYAYGTNPSTWGGVGSSGTTANNGNHNHTVNIAAFNSASSGNHVHSVNIPQFNSSTTGNHAHTTDIAQFNSSTTGNHIHSTDIAQFNSGNNGGLENRPTNISVLWCIKF